jgi:ribosomal protein S18 acetylase RimI-like enzyme
VAEGISFDYDIRPLTNNDEALLWEMLYLAVFVPEGDRAPAPGVIARPDLSRYVRGWGRPHDQGCAAIHSTTGRRVGAAWVRLFSDHDRGYGYVDAETPEMSIAVATEHRRRGVGTVLLSCLIRSLMGRYPAVSLSVAKANPAVHLYRRFGFETVSESGGSLIMRLALRGPRTA